MNSGPLQSNASIAAVTAAGILLWLLVSLVLPAVQAQDGPPELPPLPILYGGRALVDGEPLPEGTRLTARVGDYEAETVVEEDGHYRNLLLAPPSGEYYAQPVTFQALNMTAAETDIFVETLAPVFKDVGFDIQFTRTVSDETSAFLTWALFTGVLLFVAALIGWLLARRLRAA